tara:strand:- start:59269 stop:59832 length:564 start_codon:yes stop_codon:yes gene_type:complete
MYDLCGGSKEAGYSNISISNEDVVIGYSFGARFALELLDRFSPKLFFALGGHAGLNPEQIEDRAKVEELFLGKLKNLDRDDFIKYWNSLDLFKHDEPITGESYNKEVLINMFEEFGLSKQKNYKEIIKANKDKIVWVNGLKDKKYSDYCEQEIAPLGVECVYLKAGHRLLQKETEILDIVKNKVKNI